MSVGNTNYPTTLDTAADLVEAANRSSSTLSAGIDNNPATTTIPLVSASTFTTSGIVAIDDEIISYTGKSGNSLTGAVRAFEGTSIASHSSGAAVRQLITAASHNVQSAAIIALETKLGTGTDIAWTQMTPLTVNRVVASDGTGDITASPITHDGTNAIVGNVGAIDFDDSPTVTAGAPSLARLTWNDGEGTLNLTVKGGNVTVPLSQRDTARVVNGSGTNLLGSNYQVVRVTTPQGQRIGVTLAQANNETNSADVLGLISENINNNNTGIVTTRGVISGINTTGSLQGETWAAGDVLFLSPTTAGGLTKVKPVSPNHLILVGYVVYAHATEGKIFVTIQTSWEIEELHDVKITGTPVAGSLLIRNATSGIWENATLTAGSNIAITNADKSITIATTGTGDVTGPASSTATAIARFSDTTGKVIQNSLIGIDSAGALGLPDNVRQTFNPGSTTPGLNVGANSGDPSTPSNGDIWYNSATSGTGNRQFRIRRNGVTSSIAIVPPSVTAEREIPTINPSTGNLDNVGELFYISADNALKLGDFGTGRLQLNAITTETPQVQATGVDANINLNLVSKGTGTVQANGVPVVTTSGSQTLTNKTINGSNNTISNVSLTTGVTGTLPIANGGTGTTSLPNNSLLLGGNTAVQSLAPGNAGNSIISTGITWQTVPAPTSVTLDGGPIVLGSLSPYQIILTDNSLPTQSVSLPDATTFTVGRGFSIYNLNATLGVLLLSNGTFVRNIPQGIRVQVVCVNTASNVAGSWAITQENGGVTSLSAGTTGLTPSTGTTGDITLGGTLAIANGGTGQTTRQNAMDALAGAVTSGQYLRGNGTDVVMSAIQAGDVPTLNQNTTGTAANVTGIVATGNGGTGQSTYTAGQLLIGNNAGGLTKATLTAGSNVTITNGDGAITIAATGGGGSATPGGATSNVQYNSSGTFAGDNGFRYSPSAGNILTLNTINSTTTNYPRLRLSKARAGESNPASSDVLGEIALQGYLASSADYVDGVTVQGRATANWSSTERSSQLLVNVRSGNNVSNQYEFNPTSLVPPGDNATTFGLSNQAWSQGHFGGKIRVGQSNNNDGSIEFRNGANSNILSLVSGATSGGNVTLTLPTDAGTANQVLRTNGSGVLSWNNSVATFSAGTTGLTPNSTSTGSVTLGGTLNVANGGTGASSLTANNVLLGNGTSAVQVVAPGTSGNVLTSNGTTWSSQPGTFGIVRTNGGISLNASSPPEVFLTDNTVNAQSVNLPDVTAAGFTVGRRFTITNQSAAAGRVSTFSGTDLSFIARGQRVVATCISTANNNASSWYIAYDNFLINPAGAENYLINSAFRVDQRLGGASRTVTTGSFQFVADRWQAQALGASVSVAATALTGLGGLTVIGAASNTGTQLRQRIEQRIINNLNDDQTGNRTVTLSFEYAAAVGVSTTFSYAINYASSGDNFSTTTPGPTGNMISQPLSNSSLFRMVSSPISISSSAGIEVIITLPALTAAQDITIRNIKLEPGNVPTPYVSVPFDVELARCRRYYEKSFSYTTAPAENLQTADSYGASTRSTLMAGAVTYLHTWFLQEKRSTPSMLFFNPGPGAAANVNLDGGVAVGSAQAANISVKGLMIGFPGGTTVVSAGTYYIHWTANSEL